MSYPLSNKSGIAPVLFPQEKSGIGQVAHTALQL